MGSVEELGRRDRKKLETRAALAEAALRLVAERGLAGVTVEDIAEAADVSSRTFFNYFPSKEDALLVAPADVETAWPKSLASAPAGLTALQALRLVLRGQAECMEQRAEEVRLRIKVIEENPSLLPRLVSGGFANERALAAAVAERIGPERAAGGYPELLSAVGLAAFRVAMLRWSRTKGSVPMTDLLDDAFDRLAAGLPEP
ncbi:TetR family transcriptional regulator [Spongiactinospora gelatinilytica]|uniref:TetR family transcriptional regulator n=1 Tax=Spongiactinospora gelatinilytica TaxID=2666298 RepID=A0A2W2GRT0_9ACTN|nr:TetR family transcriptional regulator [Spongiactinospora gelatinilytica]PZG42785.1 TetR family transcriptional regulator [Spongiactinospora gelatinilytica]